MIRLTNQVKFLIKLLKDEGLMGPQIKIFGKVTDLEDWKAKSADFQDKIDCRLDLTSITALHLTKTVKKNQSTQKSLCTNCNIELGVCVLK